MPPNTQVGERCLPPTLLAGKENDMAYNREKAIEIPDELDENTLHTMDDVYQHFSKEDAVEMIRRYIQIRWMQKKSRRVQQEKLKQLKQWGKEQGVWGAEKGEEA